MLLIVRGRSFQTLSLKNEIVCWQTDFLYRGRCKLLDCLIRRDLTLRVKNCFFKLRRQLIIDQRWSRGHKARGQGQGHKKTPRSRPRTSLPTTEPLEAKDRNARGQEPRTQALVLSEKKIFQKNFSGNLQNFNNLKNSAVLEPRTGQFSRT